MITAIFILSILVLVSITVPFLSLSGWMDQLLLVVFLVSSVALSILGIIHFFTT